MNETPESNQTPASRSFLWIVVIVVHVLSAIVFVSVCVFVVPTFEVMFADMGAQLPVLTQILIGTSRWICDYIIIVPFLVSFRFIIDVLLLIKFREHSKMILMVSFLSLIGGFAFVVICLYLPIFSMANGI